jgi:hypothetical protein
MSLKTQSLQFLDIASYLAPNYAYDAYMKAYKCKLEKEIPSFQTRQVPLGENSIQDYMSKANKINEFFKNRKPPQPVRAEL